ncbi:hypothetical protein CSV72_09875 [Sporosarcina sp. P20a]|uniref:hypothetical protein n=1 Tax=Sporosarcina sp. P20a TaxID=2048256 RepID=UPI000C1686B4|nr:hypothetical protein [Sporosarcina sp. P20a]PIC86115.1 hypothetical protein CSV72_09875 [Sporosarcina sp. P20a]
MKVMIDTNIYDCLIVDEEVLSLVRSLIGEEIIEILTTHIQIDEVNNVNDITMRNNLLTVPTNEIKTRILVIGHSRIGKSKIGIGKENGIKFISIHKDNPKHINDAIIAVTANANADILVTEDKKLKQKVQAQSSKLQVWNYKEFKEHIIHYR